METLSVLKHGVCGHISMSQDAHYFGKIRTQMLIGTQPTQADIRQVSTKLGELWVQH